MGPVRKLIFIVLIFYAPISYCQPVDSSAFEIAQSEVFDYEKSIFIGESDTTSVTGRNFDKGKISELKADEDLNYKQPPTVVETLWDRFLNWIKWLFASLFEAAVSTDIGNLVIYIIAAIAIVVVIMMLLKVNAFKVFYSGADKGQQTYSVFHENIHEMNFESLIQQAVEKKEFRLATRLIFLNALKILSDKHLIDFNPGKTNHDYVEEVKVPELKTGFSELSFYFDYAWYGNFKITDIQFQRIRTLFGEWRDKVNT